MDLTKIKLYRILRNVGLDRTQINLFSVFNEELNFDQFDKICYINYLENTFNITIPDNDIPRLVTIDKTLDYIHDKTIGFGGLN